MDESPTSDPRLGVAVRASHAWYEDVFAAHSIQTRTEDGLWRAMGDPPRWHSAAKTLRPDVPEERVVAAVDRFARCSVADSFGSLDLTALGFVKLFAATWVFWLARTEDPAPWPEDWTVVTGEDELAEWNVLQDTTGVLLPSMLEHPRFTFLVRRSSGRMVAGGVLHRVDDAVELSNTWATGDEADELRGVLACAENLHPPLPVVGYVGDDLLGACTDAGFAPVGPQVVWLRESRP